MTEDNVVLIRNRMTEADFKRAWQQHLDLHGDNLTEANGRRQQHLAALFWRSGWTQEELAKTIGRSQSWIQYRLRFGRFLNFTTTVVNPEPLPANLTERRFRSYWEQADKMGGNERQRYTAVLKAIRAAPITSSRRDPVGQDIRNKFADGKWHAPETIARGIGADPDHVLETLRGISKNQTYGMRAEHKRVGKETHFRLFRQTRLISSDEISAKLRPLIDGLKQEGKKNSVTVSIGSVARLAALLERQIDEWAQDTDC